jgi:multiple sugar transport system substrate-binding protein
MSESKKVSRRSFMKTAAASVVGLAVGAGIGYSVSRMGGAGPTETVTVTTGTGAGEFPFNIPVEGDTPAERAINAANELLEQNPEWNGSELIIAHPGGYGSGYDAMKDEWEQRTGTKLVHADIPVNELFDKVMVEAVSRTGGYDLFCIQPMMVADLAASGVIYQLDDASKWFDNRQHGKPDGYIYPLEYIMPMYAGKLYGYVHDGDVFTTYYNKEWMDESGEKEGYEAQYGRPLETAKTIREYLDLAEWFTRPDDNKWGNNENREVNRNYIYFWAYFNSREYPNKYPFDDDMNPTITDNKSIEVAEAFVEAVKYMPPGHLSLSGITTYESFAQGLIFENINFPSAANKYNDEASVSRGKWITDVIPGWYVEGPDGKEVLLRRSVQGAGWVSSVNNHSKKKELAVLFAQYLTDPQKLILAHLAPASWHDPCRYNAVGESAPTELKDNRGPLLPPFEKNASIVTPVVSGIRGATEYNTVLSKNLHAAMLGTTDPATALEDTAEKWQDISERLGKDKQIEDWLKYKKWYPTVLI